MHRFFTFIRKGLASLRPVGRVRFKVKEPAKSSKDIRDYSNPLLNLPAELILMIADFLDEEFQAVLSLSCKQLRVLLKDCLNLSLSDKDVKLRFLQCIEPDYPEYLPCRSCGCMFKWRPGRFLGYRCPRARYHPYTYTSTSYPWPIHGNGAIWVTREVVDLIFRAHQRGQQYGVPVSALSTGRIDYGGVTRKNEARLVDGQLLLASCWEADSESRQDMVEKARLFNIALCRHQAKNVWGEEVWQPIEKAVAGMTDTGKPTVAKCPFCATDYELRVENITDGRIRIVLNVWRNYGRRHENLLENEQLFHLRPSSRIDADALSRRDLHSVFGSYGSGQ